ncbi:uncharacterized protein MELLADRAFT_90105 [Melampsora larici-populina 98AG31]|uniref:Secreted protein n=1 Tax=Melampsora larici-populina (strain 98AG31 / pathotype 3-4-7) TaxID=747676 RepID=F4RVP1_MELLP|nr:uncharacterized protein MELLADRAFT_90105 [Melampsora larici-populina 98AG31]EGG03548.1 hypothetical protein MELLADRAFT_90105 [Melampsora larici-populina 98AG31]
MRVTDWIPMKICSLAFTLLVINATPIQSLPSGSAEFHSPVVDSQQLAGLTINGKRFRRRGGIPLPRIYPIPLVWGVDWNLLWYFVDPDKLTREGLSPQNFKNIDNKRVATLRETALQAATRAIEVYDLLHPEENVKALAEIRRLAILESEPDLSQEDQKEEDRLKTNLWEVFQKNPTLKESTTAIFLANVPEHTKAKFQQISHDMNGARYADKPTRTENQKSNDEDQDQDSDHDGNDDDNDGDEDQEKDKKGDQEPAKDWAHVQLWDSEPVDEF